MLAANIALAECARLAPLRFTEIWQCRGEVQHVKMIRIFPLFLSAPSTAGCRMQYLQTVVKLDQHCQCHCCKKPVPRHANHMPIIPFLFCFRCWRSRQHDANHAVSKGFSIQPSVLLLVYTTSRDGGCIAGLRYDDIRETATSNHFAGGTTPCPREPWLWWGANLCWYFLLGGMVECSTMDHRSVLIEPTQLGPRKHEPRDLMGKSWHHNGFRAPYWRWEVTWAAAFLLITMNGRPLTARLDEWRLMVTSNCA